MCHHIYSADPRSSSGGWVLTDFLCCVFVVTGLASPAQSDNRTLCLTCCWGDATCRGLKWAFCDTDWGWDSSANRWGSGLAPFWFILLFLLGLSGSGSVTIEQIFLTIWLDSCFESKFKVLKLGIFMSLLESFWLGRYLLSVWHPELWRESAGWHSCQLCAFQVSGNWVNMILCEICFTQDCKGTMCVTHANRTNALGHEIIHPVSLPVPLPEGFSLDLDWLSL